MNLKKITRITLLILSYIFNASKSIADIKPEHFFKMIEKNDVDGVTLAILDGFEINKGYVLPHNKKYSKEFSLPHKKVLENARTSPLSV